MQAYHEFRCASTPSDEQEPLCDERLRKIAYSMDALIPGFYVWLGNIRIAIGGSNPDDTPYRYPGTVNSAAGLALVLPGYRIFTTYRGSYDPR